MKEHLMVVISNEMPTNEDELPNNLYVKGANIPNKSGLPNAWNINKHGLIKSPVIWWIGYAESSEIAIEKCKQNWREKNGQS